MPPENRTRVLILLSLAELLAMSLWFTGTAVGPALGREWRAGLGLTSWLTIAVQLGFVAGALVSAALNLPDIFSAPRVFVVSALAGAAANAAFGYVAASQPLAAIVLRFLTGACLAGVYPTGMKILAGWFRDGRGLALGILVGALTVGSAVPHGVLALSASSLHDWRAVVLASSGLAVVAAVIVAFGVHDGPFAAPSPPFDPTQIGEVFRNRGVRLANFGYLGHMWELYSMWGWMAVLLAAANAGATTPEVELAAFFAIAVGLVGCVWAGRVSDRAPGDGRTRQRAKVTIVAMAVSGACCLLAALVFDHYWALVLVALVWGVAVVADSAQFSTLVSELSDPRYVGTALTTQTALGFLLTTISLRVVAAIAGHWGWRWAAASLAIGPALGIWAMAALAAQPHHENTQTGSPTT